MKQALETPSTCLPTRVSSLLSLHRTCVSFFSRYHCQYACFFWQYDRSNISRCRKKLGLSQFGPISHHESWFLCQPQISFENCFGSNLLPCKTCMWYQRCCISDILLGEVSCTIDWSRGRCFPTCHPRCVVRVQGGYCMWPDNLKYT